MKPLLNVGVNQLKTHGFKNDIFNKYLEIFIKIGKRYKEKKTL